MSRSSSSRPRTAAAPMRRAGSTSQARTACTRWRPSHSGTCPHRTVRTRPARPLVRQCQRRTASAPRCPWLQRSLGWLVYTQTPSSGASHWSISRSGTAAEGHCPVDKSCRWDIQGVQRWRRRGRSSAQGRSRHILPTFDRSACRMPRQGCPGSRKRASLAGL